MFQIDADESMKLANFEAPFALKCPRNVKQLNYFNINYVKIFKAWF